MNTSTVFPSLACTDLLNNPITIPKDIKGKKSILVLAASKKAEDNLQSWMLPLFNTFIADNSKNMFATTSYDVNTFFIPVFSGVAKAAANNIKKKMLNGLDPLLQSHVLIYKGSANKLFDELGLDKKEVALLIIDENGNTLKTIEGGYTDEKMENIEEFLIQ
tara:strand:+ start:389 stop:874 length:486 start_codon:yes stop_codon:yes gene_type:complete